MKRTKVLRVAAVCAFSAALIFTSCQPTTGIEDQSKTEKTESEQKNETEEKTDEKKEEKVEEKKEESEEKTDEKTEEKTEDKTDEKTDEKTEDKTDEKTEDKTDEKADDKVEDKTEEKLPAVKEGYFRFVSTADAAETGSVQFIVNYESAVLDAASKLSSVDIAYMLNDGDEQHYTNVVKISKNTYGSDYQAKIALFPDVKIKKDDAVYIKVSAKVDVEAAATIIQGNLIDTDASVDYWKEMCVESEQKQILTGITYEAPVADTNTTTVLFEGTRELDWANESKRVIISNADTSDMTASNKLVFEVEIVEGGDCVVQIQDGGWTKVLNEGTLEGGQSNTGNTFQVTENGTVKYTPSAAELELIKANGFVAFGQGTIKKISIE